MTSFEAEAEMEQYSENHVELASSCGEPQLAYGNSTKDHSHDQKFMERESPDSPSPVKRWEFGQILQSFKSKMASFTEIVMSPVRLFKPTDTLSSIVHPAQHERRIESNEESLTWTEEGETTDDECKNGLLSKRLSSERVQCNSSPKRCRVAQRLNFETVSTSNHEPVLECNEVCDDVRVAHKQNNQTDRPSSQLRTVLHNKNYPRPTTQSTFPNSDSIPSSEKTSNSTHDLHRTSHANSNTACGDSSESDAVFAASTVKNSRNKLNSSNTSSDFLLKDEDRSRIEESSARAVRKSPRKVFKHTSETAADLAASASGPKSLNDRMKDLHFINVTEQMHRSTEVSDPPKSTSFGHVRSKRCREALRTETQKHMVAKRKRQARKAEDRGLRRAKNKNDSSITFEENQEDIVCVQMRKKRRDMSAAQKLNTSNIADVEIRNSDTSESCDSTEMGQEKTVKTNLRKTIKCKSLLASSNEGDCDIASQNATGNVDKSLQRRNMNTMNDCNYESRPSEFQKHDGEKTRARKTRHVFKTAGEVSFQKRSLRPPKHKFEDYSTTSVFDPAGPSGPSKRTLFQCDRPCGESQMTFIAGEEQMTSLCGPEARENKKRLTSPPLHPESTVSLQSERSPNRPTKTVNRPKRKQRENVIGAKDEAKIPEKTLEAISVESSSGSGSNRLLRSYSCPELPFLVFSGCNVPPSHTHENGSTSPTKKSTAVPLPSHLHSPSKRTRRHTVCSVEIDREIAPLCLRKEVYPASRGASSSPYSPSNSLTALASCFLSSPLAFLSKSSSHRRGSAHSDASCFTSGYVTSSSPSLCSSPFASTLTSSDPVTDPSTVVTPSPEIPSASVSSLCSSSQSALEGDHEILQMECRRAMDEEERSSFSLSISEEKALSDSEIKMDNKEGQERRGKVSSIRICKKIPKPQNNLTPMGLPKVIRMKKKDFSVEEIYTNKNFSKPPDGRLETIFEVALNRRDGSQVVVGQKKVKRFVEFPELGVVRKPKKPLVGGTAAQRKAGGNSGFCRTRRGLGVSSKVEDGLTLQELDSLLCSKLQELDTWMALQQIAC